MQTDLKSLGLGRKTLLMGVLNVTPDSFSDGGLFLDSDTATCRALEMLDQGADIIDIGGESTRPATFRDQQPLSAEDELARVIPVIAGILESRPDTWISIDTYKADVARQAVAAGASICNDVSGFGAGPEMAQVVAQSGAYVVVMHMPGLPHHMPDKPDYGDDIIAHLLGYFHERMSIAKAAGVEDSKIIIDPGLGFGKDTAQNVEIIRRLAELTALGCPILSGPSRKRFLGALLGGLEPGQRLPGTAAAVTLSIANGADIVRVHDVAFIAHTIKVCDGIVRPT